MLMIPSKVVGHTRFLLERFNDSDVDSIAQEICQDRGVQMPKQIQNVLLFLQIFEDLSGHLDFFIHNLSSAQRRDDFSFALMPILLKTFLKLTFSGAWIFTVIPLKMSLRIHC